MTWRDSRADTTVLAHGPEGSPVLLTTRVATFYITRAAGHPLPEMTVVQVGKHVESIRSLLGRAPRVGFFGDADFPDLLTYLDAREVVRDLSFIGVSDAFLRAMGLDEIPSDMMRTELVEEEECESSGLASLLARDVWEPLGSKVEAELRKGHFVLDPLPWAVRNGRVADYVRAMAHGMGL